MRPNRAQAAPINQSTSAFTKTHALSPVHSSPPSTNHNGLHLRPRKSQYPTIGPQGKPNKQLTSTPARRLHSHNINHLPITQHPRAQQTAPERPAAPASGPPQRHRRARARTTRTHQPRSPHRLAGNRQRQVERRAGEERPHAADCRLDEREAEVGGEGQLNVAERV